MGNEAGRVLQPLISSEDIGIDEVTTQQIADRADIGTGTLFLYAKTKGELLMLVQNSSYVDALACGRAAGRQPKASRTCSVP